MRKSAQWLIGLAISVLAFGLAFRGANLGDVMAALGSANYLYVWPALALTFLGQLARAMSWRTLLGQHIPFGRVFAALNEGYLLNNVLPFRLGELGRAYLISRGNDLRPTQALSSVLVERMLDLLMILLMLMAFLPLVIGLAKVREAAMLSALVGIVALAGLLVLARQREQAMALVRWVLGRIGVNPARWESRTGAFVDGLAVLQDARRSLTAAFWSGLAWVSAGLSAWILLRGFLPWASLDMGFFVLIISALGIAAPSAPGYVGVFEAAVVLALSAFGVDKSLALSYAIVFHVLIFVLVSALGVIALAREGETLSHLAQAARALVSNSARDSVSSSE